MGKKDKQTEEVAAQEEVPTETEAAPPKKRGRPPGPGGPKPTETEVAPPKKRGRPPGPVGPKPSETEAA